MLFRPAILPIPRETCNASYCRGVFLAYPKRVFTQTDETPMDSAEEKNIEDQTSAKSTVPSEAIASGADALYTAKNVNSFLHVSDALGHARQVECLVFLCHCSQIRFPRAPIASQSSISHPTTDTRTYSHTQKHKLTASARA